MTNLLLKIRYDYMGTNEQYAQPPAEVVNLEAGRVDECYDVLY